MMELTTIERMLLNKLLTEQQAALAPIQAQIDAAVRAIAERVGVTPERLKIDLDTGALTEREPDQSEDT